MRITLKPLMLLIVGFAILQLSVSLFFVNPQLRISLEKLEETERQLNDALRKVNESKAELDSLKLNMLKFNNYLVAIQAQTEVLYKEKALSEGRFRLKRDSVLSEIKNARAKADTIVIPKLKVLDSRSSSQ